MVAPGHDGALLCVLSPTPCVLLWLLLLTLQLFFYNRCLLGATLCRVLLMDKILHHLTTLPWKGRIATPVPPHSMLARPL